MRLGKLKLSRVRWVVSTTVSGRRGQLSAARVKLQAARSKRLLQEAAATAIASLSKAANLRAAAWLAVGGDGYTGLLVKSRGATDEPMSVSC